MRRRHGPPRVSILDPFERGVVVGLILGEGSFTPDRGRPGLIIGMHVRHEQLLRWLRDLVPGSRLYGPYEHAGRRFFRWTLRGHALLMFLPEIEYEIRRLCPHVGHRLDRMLAAGGYR